MPGIKNQFTTGQQLLQSVARRYASQHGLHPDKIIDFTACGPPRSREGHEENRQNLSSSDRAYFR